MSQNIFHAQGVENQNIVHSSVNFIEIQKKNFIRDAVMGILDNHNLRDVAEGDINGIQWRQTYHSLGKQQPVALVDIFSQDGEKHKVVIRPSNTQQQEKMFHLLYHKYPSVRKFFPKLYAVIEKDDKIIYALEQLQGLEEKKDYKQRQENLNYKGFIEFIQNPKNFQKLVDEMWEMISAFVEEGLGIQDIQPTAGHNIYYNKNSDQFQFFDIDTIYESSESKVFNYMKAIDLMNKYGDSDAKFTLEMLKKFYKSGLLEKGVIQGSELIHDFVVIKNYQGKEYFPFYRFYSEHKNVTSEDELYDDIAQSQYFDRIRYEQKGLSLPRFQILTQHGYSTLALNPDIIESLEDGDDEKVMQLLEEFRGEDRFSEKQLLILGFKNIVYDNWNHEIEDKIKKEADCIRSGGLSWGV